MHGTLRGPHQRFTRSCTETRMGSGCGARVYARRGDLTPDSPPLFLAGLILWQVCASRSMTHQKSKKKTSQLKKRTMSQKDRGARDTDIKSHRPTINLAQRRIMPLPLLSPCLCRFQDSGACGILPHACVAAGIALGVRTPENRERRGRCSDHDLFASAAAIVGHYPRPRPLGRRSPSIATNFNKDPLLQVSRTASIRSVFSGRRPDSDHCSRLSSSP